MFKIISCRLRQQQSDLDIEVLLTLPIFNSQEPLMFFLHPKFQFHFPKHLQNIRKIDIPEHFSFNSQINEPPLELNLNVTPSFQLPQSFREYSIR